MSETKPTIYTIPVDDKFIIYAPLKKFAFIGNRAMVNAINIQLDYPEDNEFIKNELIQTLREKGFFAADKIRLPLCECDQPFNPTICILMPTTACNLACTYCYAASKDKKHAVLPWPVAKKAIDIAFENASKNKKGKFSLSFHGGGEPTLNKALFLKATNYAKSLDQNCPISVTTNAVWSKAFRDKALDLLSEISISFDGNEITQNRQRPDIKGIGTFARVLDTIREIEKRKISYGIRMTVTKESLLELRSNIEFLCEHTTCKSFQVEAVYNQGRAVGAGLTIDDVDAFVTIFMDVYTFAKEKGKSIHYSSARPHLTTNTFCTATATALIVTADSELTACYEVFDRSHILANDFIIGRLDLQEGIVLFQKQREKLLAKISSNRNNCKDCFCLYHCAGDCPPKAFIANSNNDQFRCTVTRAITRELILYKIAESDGFWNGNFKGRQRISVPIKSEEE